MRTLSMILRTCLLSLFFAGTATAQWVAIQTPDSSQIYCIIGSSLGLFAGTDSGSYFSDDHGTSWSALSSGLIKPVKNIAVSGTNIYVATNASLYLSANSGVQWTEINQRGPGSYGYPGLVTDGNRVFAGGIGHSRGDMESDFGWIISSDSLGTNWRDTILENGINSLVLFDTLIIAGNNGYQGPLGTVTPPPDNVNGNPSANSDGYIYISTDFGNTWASVTGPTSPPKRLITNSTNIFAGTWDAGVFRSSNNGTDWIQSNNGLTDNFISCFAVSGSAVFVGNGSGVFLTTDNAAQWRPVNIGLTDLSVAGLTVADSTLFAITNNGSFKLWKCPLSEMIIDNVEQLSKEIPTQYTLSQNYPNPFNPTTTISYQLPTQSHVTLKIFDVLGREVATLIDGVEQAGHKSVNFDASKLSSGVYYYRLQAGNYIETKKLLLLR